ncbi:kinase-like domain-containing protein, partial [Pyronema omphalodes]
MPSPNPESILPTHLRKSLLKSSHVQSLWSGFGSIYRLTFSGSPKSLILKHVDPPRSSSESDQRKLISYRIERYFYSHLSSNLPEKCKVATKYPVDAAFENTAMLLEDLAVDYQLDPYSLDFKQATVVLKWLARFHATFWGKVESLPQIPPPLEAGENAGDGIWMNGGYWYLATRRDEFSYVEDKAWAPLAEEVARILSDPKRLGRTLVHGDLKAANIVFAKGYENCAVYDFQYVGAGLGVVDLVYFLGTAVDRAVMGHDGKVQELLKVYWEELVGVLGEVGLGGYTEDLMKRDLELAALDWRRFMEGWGMWGGGQGWVMRMSDIVIKRWE